MKLLENIIFIEEELLNTCYMYYKNFDSFIQHPMY